MLRSDPASDPWQPAKIASQVLLYTHYAYPVVLLVFFLLAFTANSIVTASLAAEPSGSNGPGGKPLPAGRVAAGSGAPRKARVGVSPQRKAVFNWLSVAVIASFVGNAVNVIVHSLTERGWWCGKAVAIYVVSSVFLYSLVLISLVDTHPSPTAAHLSTWIVAVLLEALLFGTSVKLYTSKHYDHRVDHKGGVSRASPSMWELTELAIDIIRTILLSVLIGLYMLFVAHRGSKAPKILENGHGPRETTRLLRRTNSDGEGPNDDAEANGISYGSTLGSPREPHKSSREEPAGWARPTKVPAKNWWEYIRGYALFFPYLWPSKSRRLQIIMIICFALVILQRVINVLVPHQLGIVTNILSGEDGADPRLPWGGICLYVFYRFMQGNMGVLGAVRSYLWIPIGQYSYQALSTSAFEHVHSLSLDFHLGKKTGEVLSALSKGNSINTFLEQVTFQVVPMLVDLAVAVGYFLVVFDAYYALVVAIVTFCYLYITIRMAQWRADIRRQMVNASREEDAVKNDSMISYETVKYFNAESYEFNRYRDAVKTFQKAEYKVLFSLNVMNVTQNMVFTVGLLVSCFISAYQVTTDNRKVGSFVSLLAYMAQLQGPLNFFGTFYRSIQSAMINSERMLELFKEKPTVVDDPHAKILPYCDGEIRFEDVHFSYDGRKPALNGLSFVSPPGTTTALVGESGGGKSTVFRLLFRFYNAQSGSIKIDGHDVRDTTIDSVRKNIGVVPQDTVLFNETLMYNLRYANPLATDEQVYDACRAASIHEKILGFPDGYATRVGERGLRLSGGEKQRVAIARTILKDPKIILLDEATAALDSETEQNIQSALQQLSKGRTMLVIAHRLSTITNADQILCLHEGHVVERGTHNELLKKKGRYASMWKKQIRAEKAAVEAKALTDAAGALVDSPAEQSEDEASSHHHGDAHGGAK
ncbi:hypothetical protein GP486_003078 [Trichoglossum hirsutum]|uniref:Heavy metal tolerance protein n=1 Tax=Trichoglossum hirsutum TaxID=265104 RepID=A0A9P8RR45_9PEZI|nr:hypothetical protein GP486_003078 [Trichoglossum hirsutum]